MKEEVWDPWLTLSPAPHCLSVFLTYSLPLGAHGALPSLSLQMPHLTLLLPSVHRYAQVPVHRYGEGQGWAKHPAASRSILGTKCTLEQRLQPLDGHLFNADWGRGPVGRGDAWLNSSTLVGTRGVRLMADGRGTWQPVGLL